MLQGARAATISESTGRAGMFLSAVSGGLVALGLIATATRVGSAFYAFGLALLPTLALIGLMTFQMVLQSGIEDHGYARRISRLRAFYFEPLRQLTDYMPRVRAQEGISARGLSHGRGQGFLTTAGMVTERRAIPRTMRAVVLDAPGPPEALTVRELPAPEPKRGWVLIEVKAFRLNRSELHTRLGLAEGVTFPAGARDRGHLRRSGAGCPESDRRGRIGGGCERGMRGRPGRRWTRQLAAGVRGGGPAGRTRAMHPDHGQYIRTT